MRKPAILTVILSLALAAAACGKKDEGGTSKPSADKDKDKDKDKGPAKSPEEAPKPAAPEIDATEVTYNSGDTVLKGYLAAPKGDGKHPGVLVVHEWWGHNDYARMRARKLAEMGYVALAVDMYGDGKKADHPADAKKFMEEAIKDKAAAYARFEAARAFLAADPRVIPDKLAAIGYCFGGGVVLHAARAGADLDLVASFHGSLATDAPMKPGAFKGTIFVANGGDDAMSPPEVQAAFEKEMKDAGANLDMVSYAGAKHSFTNPEATEMGKKFEMPIAYDEAADKASWAKLEEHLKAAFAN